MELKRVELTASGASKFNEWLYAIGKPNLNFTEIELKGLECFERQIFIGEKPAYELGQQLTKTGRPEVFILDSLDYTVKSLDAD